ncbi:DNA polymerase alpha/epsilon subunit B-domain-containing protein, partial [Gaertneriomyces semiglobifer]
DTFNDHVPLTEKTFEDQVQCDIALVPGQQTKGYRYMYEKLTAKGDFLDERIDTFADIIGQGIKASLPAEEHEEFAIQHPALPQQETLFTVGRVCCDSLTDDSKLNAQSVVVEASRAIGSGARVHLNLRQAPDYSLFPGQLIGVEGINPTGKSINVSRIHHPTLPAQATSEPSQLLSFYPSPDAAASINIIVANGPYTLSDSFNYEPFEELTVKVEAEKPDVVILQGPFVDSQHPLILSGDMEIDVDDIFRTQISPRLHRMLGSRSLKTKLICIPATTDSCSEWVSFPQPSLAAGLTDAATFERRAALGIPPEVHMFPNPVQFTINEVVFACCSMDVLWHMCGQEIWKLSPNNGQPAVQPHGATTFEMSTNRLTRFVQHMFRQRTFYPLFPPALDDACLDLSHAGALELQATPDVLIMPSRLQQFIRNIDGCVCVNPGSLVKGHSAGTFARFCIWPL